MKSEKKNTQSDVYNLAKNYFLIQKPKPLSIQLFIYIILSILIMVAGLMLLFRNSSTTIMIMIISSLLLLRIIIYPYFLKKKMYKNKPSDNELEEYLINQFKTKIAERAFKHLRININKIPKEKLIIIPYPVVNETKQIERSKMLREPSKNNYFNYNFWNVQILILNKTFVSYYSCAYNLLDDEIINEKSSEFFYSDIALVKSDIEEQNIPCKWNSGEINQIHFLKLINISGDVLSLVTMIPELKASPNLSIDEEKIIHLFRLIIRSIRNKQSPAWEINTNPNFNPVPVNDELIVNTLA